MPTRRVPLGLTDDAQRALGASLPPMTFAEKVAAEYRELAMAPSAHAVELFRERLAARGVIPVAEAMPARLLDGPAGRAGGQRPAPDDRQELRLHRAGGRDRHDQRDGRPEIYQANRAVLHRHPLLVIDGTLQVEGEVLNVVARRLHPVDAVVNEEARQTRCRWASSSACSADQPAGSTPTTSADQGQKMSPLSVPSSTNDGRPSHSSIVISPIRTRPTVPELRRP